MITEDKITDFFVLQMISAKFLMHRLRLFHLRKPPTFKDVVIL